MTGVAVDKKSKGLGAHVKLRKEINEQRQRIAAIKENRPQLLSQSEDYDEFDGVCNFNTQQEITRDDDTFEVEYDDEEYAECDAPTDEDEDDEEKIGGQQSSRKMKSVDKATAMKSKS